MMNDSEEFFRQLVKDLDEGWITIEDIEFFGEKDYDSYVGEEGFETVELVERKGIKIEILCRQNRGGDRCKNLFTLGLKMRNAGED